MCLTISNSTKLSPHVDVIPQIRGRSLGSPAPRCPISSGVFRSNNSLDLLCPDTDFISALRWPIRTGFLKSKFQVWLFIFSCMTGLSRPKIERNSSTLRLYYTFKDSDPPTFSFQFQTPSTNLSVSPKSIHQNFNIKKPPIYNKPWNPPPL